MRKREGTEYEKVRKKEIDRKREGQSPGECEKEKGREKWMGEWVRVGGSEGQQVREWQIKGKGLRKKGREL